MWNLLGQVMALSQDIRHNKFCLRLMVKVSVVINRLDYAAVGIKHDKVGTVDVIIKAPQFSR